MTRYSKGGIYDLSLFWVFLPKPSFRTLSHLFPTIVIMDSKKEKSVLTNQPEVISSSNSLELTESQGFDWSATQRLVRKLDWHLIPFLSLIYLNVHALTTNDCNTNFI
jgi:hypothetical protein